MFESIAAGMGMVFQWSNILSVLFGVIVGMVVGAIPGLTGAMAMCLLIPFTLYFQPIAAIAMLMGISKGANFGGSVPAILFNMPGTPEAAITALEGYPLSRQGKSGKALKIALYASTMADTMSDLVLFFFAAPVAMVALKVGPPEYAMIVLFSLVIIGAVAGENFLKGLIALGIGLLLATIGLDPAFGTPRFNFGLVELSAGVGLIPLVIGLLIFSETFRQIEEGIREEDEKGYHENQQSHKAVDPSYNRVSFVEFKHCLSAIFGGVGIGSAIGAIPGIGTTVASYLSYARTKRSSKHPELFGKGALEGVAAAEAGNNAVVGPNLIPLITLGIPGNLAAALILGAFMIQGLTPGPLFMQQYAPMLYALFTVLIISNVFTFAIGSVFVRFARYLLHVPKPLLYPAIMIFGIIGSYIFRNSLFDVIVMLFLGIFGYVLMKFDIPLIPVLVAFILGQIFEERLRQALIISRGSISIFFTHPISLVFLLLIIGIIAMLSIRGFGKRKAKISSQMY